MQAVILAAGEGTRIRPLTQNHPKPLIPVANRPILEHVIYSLVKAGIRDIIVVVGYRKEQVMRHLNKLSVSVRVVEQKNQIGTAHALLCAKDLISGNVLVVPGDNYVDTDSIRSMMKVPDSVLVTTHRYPSNFGVVTIEDGYITSIEEKPLQAARMTVNCGVYHMSPTLVKEIHHQMLTESLTDFIRNNHKISAVATSGWRDAIYPWDLLCLNDRLLKNIAREKAGIISSSVVIEGSVRIGKGTVIGPNTVISGPVVIGEDCSIGPQCCIQPGCSIGSRVKIEPFSVISHSLIMEDTRIASHSTITDAVIGEGCQLGEHTAVISGEGILEIEKKPVKAYCGVIMGNGVRSSPFVTFENSIIGNDVVIDARAGLRLRSKVLPDTVQVM